jgi:hypothetical protein
MNKLLKMGLGLAATSLMLGLAGCNFNSLKGPTATIRAVITPAVGFFVNDMGKIIITSPSVRFQAAAGSMGAIITGYEATVLDSTSTPVLDDPKIINKDGLNIRVAPGIQCAISSSESECSWSSKDAKVAPGTPSAAFNAPFLPADAAIAYWNEFREGNGTTGWRVRITFKGVDDNGNLFSWKQDPNIQFPLESQ